MAHADGPLVIGPSWTEPPGTLLIDHRSETVARREQSLGSEARDREVLAGPLADTPATLKSALTLDDLHGGALLGQAEPKR